MLISKLSKAVIRRHEKIVSGNMRSAVKRRSMGRNGFGVFVPTELYIVVKCPPRRKRTSMDFRSGNLPYRLCKLADWLLPKIALPVPVVECDIPDRCPAVGES